MFTKYLFLIICNTLLAINAQNISDSKFEIDNNCVCVDYYLCDENYYIITNGESIIDPRIRSDNPTNPNSCPSNPQKWCCKLRNNNETNVNITTSTPKSTISDETQVECRKQITSDKFPWLVEIFQTKKVNKFEYVYTCSGSLIRSNIVLTSMHCVKTDAEYVVVLGNDNKFHNVNELKANQRKVTKRILHEDYNSGSLYNDIALLVLDQPFDITNESTVTTVCLPKKQEEFNGKNCLAAGFNSNNLDKVKTVNLTIVGEEVCQERLRATRLGEKYKLHSSFVCASGSNGNDNCKGDGGTPLICQNKEGNYVQVGIVSWGVECENPLVPGLYANIPNLTSWINKKLKKHSLVSMKNVSAKPDKKVLEKVEIDNNCECVLYYLCDDQNYIITNGTNLIDNRNKDETETKKPPIPCSKPLQTCCKLRPADGK